MGILKWSASNASRLISRINKFVILSYNIFCFSIMIVHHLSFQCLIAVLDSVFYLLFCKLLKLFNNARLELISSVSSHKLFRGSVLIRNFLSIWLNIRVIYRLSVRNKLAISLNHVNYLCSKFLPHIERLVFQRVDLRKNILACIIN